MDWEPLADRDTLYPQPLPLVLCGPMLRKVTRTHVTVWVALKHAATVELLVYDQHLAPVHMFRGEAIATRIGPKLYMAAVTAFTAQPLVPGHTYFYTLNFTPGGSLHTATRGALLSYIPNYQLPSFALPPDDLTRLRLIQGSCRKPIATGDDALAILDDLIADSVTDPLARPHQLLLTGDQIYADEVDDHLLLAVTDAAQFLVGSEPMPYGILAENLPPTTRARYLQNAGFTSVDRRSHLMSFGEYVAMYLMVWADVLLAHVPTSAQVEAKLITRSERKAFDAIADKPVNRYAVMSMHATLPKVRRALANVPTYMIFDDHEVTDDWNMNREFCSKVYGDPLGRRIVQNALLAYALCQHWGNAPEQFDAPGSPGSNLLTMLGTPTGYSAIAAGSAVATIVGVPAPPSDPHDMTYNVGHGAGSLAYHYAVEGPAHRIIVTDTRTWRALPGWGVLSPPHLVAESQFRVQIPDQPELEGRLLMVVVSTNFIGLPAIRQGGRDLPGLDSDYAYEDFYDGWELTRIDFLRLLVRLTKKFDPGPPDPGDPAGRRRGRVVMLSGDVHSSSACRLHYWAHQQIDDFISTPGPATLVVAHLIGSALKNHNGATEGQHTKGYEYVPPKLLAEMNKQPVMMTEGFIGWNPPSVVPPDKPVVKQFFHDRVVRHGDYPLPVHPNEPARTLRDEELPTLWNSKLVEVLERPHYRYRIDYQKRVDHGGYDRPDYPPLIALGALAKWELASRKYATHGGDGGRTIVGWSNIGEIRFARGAPDTHPDLIVKYTVRWYASEHQIAWSRFEVSLDVDDPAFLPIKHTTESWPP